MAKESSQRILDETQKPDEDIISKWIGSENYERWKQIHQFIESNHPAFFFPVIGYLEESMDGYYGSRNRNRSAR